MARKPRRISDETATVLRLFLDEPTTERFGREIIKNTGLKSGSLYPILSRMQDMGLLTSTWEEEDAAAAAQRRPRRLYRLDPTNAQQAETALDEWQQAKRVNRVIRSDLKGVVG